MAKALPPVLLMSADELIRLAGFRIHARPNDGPARWILNKNIYLHAQALEIAKRERQRLLDLIAEANNG
jgi:hypothetical protein